MLPIAIRRLLRRLSDPPVTGHDDPQLLRRVEQLEERVRLLHGAVAEAQASELERAADHAAMVDKLERIYKRFATRIAREGAAEPEESPLTLRNRLRGR